MHDPRVILLLQWGTLWQDRKGEITPMMSSKDNILLSATPLVKSSSAPETGAEEVPGQGFGKGSKEPQEGDAGADMELSVPM